MWAGADGVGASRMVGRMSRGLSVVMATWMLTAKEKEYSVTISTDDLTGGCQIWWGGCTPHDTVGALAASLFRIYGARLRLDGM